MMNQQNLSSLNRNSRKTQFAIRFIRALARIKMAKPIVSSMKTRKQCIRKIKVAADTSMATTIGSNRSWSRSLLLKHRNQIRNRVLIRQRVGAYNNNKKKKKIKMIKKEKKKIKKIDMNRKEEGGNFNQVDKLRRLVPGGEEMDFCNLLEETAHYIKCLNTQVQVMQRIADTYTTI